MNARGILRGAAALVLAGALAAASTLPAAAHGSKNTGNRSLATVLAKDGSGFDRNWNDFDILDNAVTAVLKAKPSSPVKVLADGKVALTAFLPTDRAFRNLVKDLTGKTPANEADTFAAAATLGIDTIETVLLYHVVPGKTITYRQALKAAPVELTTAQGGKITVKRSYYIFLRIVDADTDDANPYVVKADINKGNKQIAHAINPVLRPATL